MKHCVLCCGQNGEEEEIHEDKTNKFVFDELESGPSNGIIDSIKPGYGNWSQNNPEIEPLHRVEHERLHTVALLSQTSLPQTSLPQTSLPQTMLPQTMLPQTSLPQTSLPHTTLPQTSLPQTSWSGEREHGSEREREYETERERRRVEKSKASDYLEATNRGSNSDWSSRARKSKFGNDIRNDDNDGFADALMLGESAVVISRVSDSENQEHNSIHEPSHQPSPVANGKAKLTGHSDLSEEEDVTSVYSSLSTGGSERRKTGSAFRSQSPSMRHTSLSSSSGGVEVRGPHSGIKHSRSRIKSHLQVHPVNAALSANKSSKGMSVSSHDNYAACAAERGSPYSPEELEYRARVKKGFFQALYIAATPFELKDDVGKLGNYIAESVSTPYQQLKRWTMGQIKTSL